MSTRAPDRIRNRHKALAAVHWIRSFQFNIRVATQRSQRLPPTEAKLLLSMFFCQLTAHHPTKTLWANRRL
jgi:hypothetical protein